MRNTAEILRDLDGRGLLSAAQTAARELGIPVGEIVRPTGEQARRARCRLWAALSAAGMRLGTIATIFDVEPLDVTRGIDRYVRSATEETIPPASMGSTP